MDILSESTKGYDSLSLTSNHELNFASTVNNITLTTSAVHSHVFPNFEHKSVIVEVAPIDIYKIGILKKSIVFITVYIVGGVFIFHNKNILTTESTTNVVYFVLVGFATIGYGDITPITPLGQFITSIYLVIGVIALSIVTGLAFEHIDGERARHRAKRKEMLTNHMIAGLEESGHHHHYSGEFHSKNLVGLTVVNLLTVVYENLKNRASVLLVLTFSFFFMGHLEDWSIVKTIYYMTITCLTIGFGDVIPSTEWTRFYAIFLIPFGIGVVGELLGNIIGDIMTLEERSSERKYFENVTFTMANMEDMDVDHDGKVTRFEFMRYMLVAMGKIEYEDLKHIDDCFDELDQKKSGFLLMEDFYENWKSAPPTISK